MSDLNSDGVKDLVTADDSTTRKRTPGQRERYFPGHAVIQNRNGSSAVAVTDINSNGESNLVTTDDGDTTASVLLGNGNGTFQARQTITTGNRP